MQYAELEKYKKAWKNEQVFKEQSLPETDIYNFMKSEPKNINQLFRKGIMFDIILKLVLMTALLMLGCLVRIQVPYVFISVFLLIMVIAAIVMQLGILRKIPDTNLGELNLLELLRKYIDFYNSKYINSIFNSAISAPLLLITGSLFYFIIKYHIIRHLNTDDIVVLGIGLVLSYFLSLITQLRYNNFRIRQLESILHEIEESKLTGTSFLLYKNKHMKKILLVSVALVTGIITLIFLIFRFIR